MVLALIFAELLAGGVLVVSAITGHSPSEVVKGEAETVLSLKETKPLKGETGSTESASGSGSEEQQPLTTAPPADNPSKAATGLGWQELKQYVEEGRIPKKDFEQGIKELESGQLAKITPLPKQSQNTQSVH
jgi:hypothetical protein